MNHKIKIGKQVWYDLNSRGLLNAVLEEQKDAHICYINNGNSEYANYCTVELNDIAVQAILVECRITISNIEGEIVSGCDNSEERSWLAKWQRATAKLENINK
jgi:hypothetical protein